MPVRTKPVRAALPGFAVAAVLLLAGCGGASQKASAAPLARASSLRRPGGQQPVNRANGRDTGQLVLGVRYLPGQLGASRRGRPPPGPEPPAVRLAPSPGLPDNVPRDPVRKQGCCLLASRPLRRASGAAGLSFTAGRRSVPLENITRAVY